MLPETLKMIRNNKEMSQKELANILGVSQQTIGSWEVGRTSPDPEMINRIARFFNVTTDYLLGNDVPAAATNTMLTASRTAFHATPENIDFIERYNKLDEKGKATVQQILSLVEKANTNDE